MALYAETSNISSSERKINFVTTRIKTDTTTIVIIFDNGDFSELLLSDRSIFKSFKDLFYHSFLAPQCNSTRTDGDLAVIGSDFYFYEDPILAGQRMN